MWSFDLISFSTIIVSSKAFTAFNSSGSKCLIAATIGELPVGLSKNAVLPSFLRENLDSVLLKPENVHL